MGELQYPIFLLHFPPIANQMSHSLPIWMPKCRLVNSSIQSTPTGDQKSFPEILNAYERNLLIDVRPSTWCHWKQLPFKMSWTRKLECRRKISEICRFLKILCRNVLHRVTEFRRKCFGIRKSRRVQSPAIMWRSLWCKGEIWEGKWTSPEVRNIGQLPQSHHIVNIVLRKGDSQSSSTRARKHWLR